MGGPYKRVLLKLSGEILAGDNRFGLDYKAMKEICSEIARVAKAGVEIAMVVGGGNFIRGIEAVDQGMERVQADHMGMLATVINGLALQDALEQLGTPSRVQTAIEMRALAEPFIRRRAIRHLEKGRIVIFAGGTGSPYFSTDTAAALRASEIDADCLLKATKVNGIYDKDPVKFPDAKLLPRVGYLDAIRMQLKIMDAAAFSLCEENKMPIVVFDVLEKGNLERLLIAGEQIGSVVV
ncbi:UMP kinase [Synergistaceae bacterium OttesenSCG-928-I11]|nr:UMP kinase [Synergistaceae bacterium OttesenSCG-928-I11]